MKDMLSVAGNAKINSHPLRLPGGIAIALHGSLFNAISFNPVVYNPLRDNDTPLSLTVKQDLWKVFLASTILYDCILENPHKENLLKEVKILGGTRIIR